MPAIRVRPATFAVMGRSYKELPHATGNWGIAVFYPLEGVLS